MNTLRRCGFTLIELLTVLLILSLLTLLSYRGLNTVLESREHVAREAEKWRSMAAFFARFERDVHLAMPRAVRTGAGVAAAWSAMPGSRRLEFSRFASTDGVDTARRIGYRLNEQQQIELWLWPGLDIATAAAPERYPLVEGVSRFELRYLDASLAWVNAWPAAGGESQLPRAVELRIALTSGEQIVRIFELQSS